MSATLYVDGLLASLSKPELKGMFSRFGTVLTIDIVKAPTLHSVGIGTVEMETLAEMIGTTRSRVSYFMNKFRKLGFIDYNGELHVHSSLLKVVLHD